MRKIFSPKRNEEENTNERRINAGLRAIINEPDIVGILKSRRIRAKGQILREITIWKSKKKRPRSRPRQR